MKTPSRRSPFGLVTTTTILLLLTPATQAAEPFVWQTATPKSQGMSKEKLDALKDSLAAKNTKAFLVIRNDKIVYEWYAKDHSATVKHGTASLAKAIVGGLSLGVALTDGVIALDDKVSKYIPQWQDDPRKSQITIRHLGSHTSGLSDSSMPGVKHGDEPSWMGDFWKRLDPPNDPFTIARDQTPTLFDAGQKIQYSNPGIGIMTYCVTAALKNSEHKDIRTLLRDRVMRPLGVHDEEWSVGYGKTFTVDGLPHVAAWGGGNYTARAGARIGRLILREGDWDGKQLLSKEAVRQITTDAGLPGSCGMGWWTNAAGRYAKLPKDAVYGAGAGDQILLVIPSLNLIMVRNGATLAEPPQQPKDVFAAFHDERVQILFEPLIDAILADAPKAPASGGKAEAKPAAASQTPGQLTVAADDDQIAVTSSFGTGWKAVIDRQRGGVIRELRFPADGDNVVSNDGSRFEGLFNTIYVDFKETGKESGYVAKGSLYYFGKVSKLSVVERNTDRVVVEVEGKGGNQVEPKADVLRYRQRYTFLADRILCDGELEWLFDKVVPGSHPQLLQMQCLFAPGAVTGELRVWDADTGPIVLPQTNSKGKNYPAGIDYPLTVEVPLQGGRALRFRSLQLPDAHVQARFYWNEYPKQIDNKRGFGFKAWEGWPGNGKVSFGKDEIIKYRYEVAVAAPLPPNSPVIEKLTWAPKETISRQAKDSDNWPLTWADDNHLYTAYGDGTGFEPKVPEKLSLGLARIEGGPPDFKGINIRSDTGEQTKGDGKTGKKASGLLMVDGVLYLLVRNAGNAQLAWSADHGKTWTWSDWKFTTSFGCPSFLNFGKNYAGARDEYVYVYSHDSESAYQPADRIVLARVAKEQIRQREAYEFFKGPGKDGSPIWTKDLAERGAVFTNPGKCYRISVSYNVGLKRYLLCQAGADRPVQAGFGIFDAPEPWGPWTTVCYSTGWDVSPGETCSFPTKWMSADGKTLHLVFSGEDCISVRQAILQLSRKVDDPQPKENQ